MSCLSFEINKNHKYIIFIFISYFIREFVDEKLDEVFNRKKIDYKFGETEKATKQLFNMYIFTISNYLSFFCICIIKLNTKSKSKIYVNDNTNKSIASNHIQYIYKSNDLPISLKKLLIRTFILTVCDFLAQSIIFIFYFIVNKDEAFVVRERMDFLNIVFILSIYLFSKIILYTRYYKHHYLSFLISLLCLIILGIFELTKIKYNKYVIYYLFIRIFSLICYSLEDVIGKKALIEEFLSPYSLVAYKGLYKLIILFIYSIPFFFIKRKGTIIFSKMGGFLNDYKKVLLFCLLMVSNFVYNIFIWIIIDRFSPNDYAITKIFEGITDKIFMKIYKTNNTMNDYIFIFYIFIYIILIIGICIHSEIIVINKCGLSDYTKKRLEKKGDEDVELSKSYIRDTSFGEGDTKKKFIGRATDTKESPQNREMDSSSDNILKNRKTMYLNPLYSLNRDDEEM